MCGRKIFILSVVSLFLVTIVVPAGHHAPVIHSAERTLNFGERGDDEEFVHVFVIENRGDLSLVIERIHSTCGCAVTNVSQRVVPPGGKAELRAEIKLAGYSGRLEREIRVETNDPRQPVYRLYLKGTVIPSREITPPHFLFAAAGGPQTRSINIKYNRHPRRIGKIRSNQEFLHLELDVLDQGTNYRLNATLIPDKLAGESEGSVNVFDERGRELFSIPVWIQYEPPLRIAPDRITLSLPQRRAVTRHILVRPGAVTRFNITDVETPAAGMTTAVYSLGGGGYRIQIDNIESTQELEGSHIVIHTDAEGAGRIEVPFILEHREE